VTMIYVALVTPFEVAFISPKVGGAYRRLNPVQLTHSLKAPGFVSTLEVP
jgi:hypothetical protein